MWKAAINALLDGNIMSQKEFAQNCGVSAQTVSNWLNDVRNPGIMAKRRIMEIIQESQVEMKKNKDLFHSVVSVASSGRDRDRLADLLSNMTDEQVKKLLKMAEKVA